MHAGARVERAGVELRDTVVVELGEVRRGVLQLRRDARQRLVHPRRHLAAARGTAVSPTRETRGAYAARVRVRRSFAFRAVINK